MHPVAQILETRGITQRWLARQLGIDESLLSKYLRGSRQMPTGVVNRCALVLQVPASVLTSHVVDVPSGTTLVPTEAVTA